MKLHAASPPIKAACFMEQVLRITSLACMHGRENLSSETCS